MTGAGEHDRADDLGREARWLARCDVETDDMPAWSVTQWVEWWSDGMEIWFSEAISADRELAFAPIRIDPDREEDPADAIVAVLQRFLTSEKKGKSQRARTALKRRDAIEQSLTDVMGRKSDVITEARVLFLLQVAIELPSKQIAHTVRSALMAFHHGWFEVADRADFLSSIARAIFEGFTSTDLESVREEVEGLLADDENFRSVLDYCLKAYGQSFGECIGKFHELWKYGQYKSMPDVWKIVSRRVNEIFTERFAALEICRIDLLISTVEISSNDISIKEISTDCFLAAQKLAIFHGLPGSLTEKSWEVEPEETKRAWASREGEPA